MAHRTGPTPVDSQAERAATPPFFSSRRERRLWIWTAAIVVGIYSTLGLARTLTDVLSDRNLLDATFVFGAFLVLGAMLALGLKTPPGGVEVGIALGVVAVFLLVPVRMGLPITRTHLMEYSVVAIFIYAALRERAGNGRRVPAPAVLAMIATAVVGVLDEVIQLFIPSRVFDPVDIWFNVFAAVVAVLASKALARVPT